MSYTRLYDMALQGMQIEKTRVDLVANNIANQHTIKTSTGKMYQPTMLQTTAKPFTDWLVTQGGGVESMEIVAQSLPPNKVWQPGHPEADQQGYVTMPGISTVDEMITLLNASRAYEANIKVFNTAHTLFTQALTIGEER